MFHHTYAKRETYTKSVCSVAGVFCANEFHTFKCCRRNTKARSFHVSFVLFVSSRVLSLCPALFVYPSLSLPIFMRRRASFSVVLTDKFAIETFQQMFTKGLVQWDQSNSKMRKTSSAMIFPACRRSFQVFLEDIIGAHNTLDFYSIFQAFGQFNNCFS